MQADEYLENRLENQILWYDGKSQTNKRRLLITRSVEILCAAVIPFLAGYAKSGSECVALSIGLLGILVASCAGAATLFQLQENWIKYRTTAESLKKGKFMYLTKVEPYNQKRSLPILVQRVETLISQENTNWAQYMTKSIKGGQDG